MDQTALLAAALSEYQEEEVEGTILNILAPGNEMLEAVVSDYFKAIREDQDKTPVACFWEQMRSNVGKIIGGKNIVVCVF